VEIQDWKLEIGTAWKKVVVSSVVWGLWFVCELFVVCGCSSKDSSSYEPFIKRSDPTFELLSRHQQLVVLNNTTKFHTQQTTIHLHQSAV